MHPPKIQSTLGALLAVVALASTTATHAQSTASLFSDAALPLVASENDPQAVELGVRFYAKEDGVIDAIRFYRGNGGDGQFRVRLYETDGTVLGQGNTFEGLPFRIPGWGAIPLTEPVFIEAGKTYVATYYTPAGNYAVDDLFFLGQGVDTGLLVAPPEGLHPDGGPTSVYRYGVQNLLTTGLPEDNYLGSNYWVDVSFTPETPVFAAYPDTASVTVGTRFTPTRDGSVSGVRFYREDQGDGVFYARLHDSSGNLIAQALAGNGLPAALPGWATLTFPGPVPVEAGETYTVSYYNAGGRYAFTGDFYSQPRTVGFLTYPVGAGVYRYGPLAGAVPSQSYLNSRYWVEPVYTPAP